MDEHHLLLLGSLLCDSIIAATIVVIVYNARRTPRPIRLAQVSLGAYVIAMCYVKFVEIAGIQGRWSDWALLVTSVFVVFCLIPSVGAFLKTYGEKNSSE